MRKMFFSEEAEDCRRQAEEFKGRPEGPFLLNIARAFDEMAADDEHSARSPFPPKPAHH